MSEGKSKRVLLANSLRKFALLRECDDNLQWIDEQKQAALRYKVENLKTTTSVADDDNAAADHHDGSGDASNADDKTPSPTAATVDAVGLEEVETLQKQLDDFQRVRTFCVFVDIMFVFKALFMSTG